jgi:hypothetical protein
MTVTQKNISPYVITALSLMCVLLAHFTYAQIDSFDYSVDTRVNQRTAVTLTMDPQYPNPGDVVHITLTGEELVDLSHGVITWSVNGKDVPQHDGTTLDVTAGALGTESVVSVRIKEPDGTLYSASTSIIPTHIDVLVDSDSYTPPFYRGRAQPSAGTQMRLQARVYFKRANESLVPTSSIIYTWSRNGEIIGSVSGLGRSTITIPSPTLYGVDTIMVRAVSIDNTFSGSASIRIASVEPVLNLYQNHPLFGILYHQAMGAQTAIPDSEMTFAAIPYFAHIQNPNDSHLRYTWHVNDIPVTGSATHANEITINTDKSRGSATIKLSVVHSSNLFMSAVGTWRVAFKSSGQTSNPFLSNISNGFQ